MQFSSSVIYWLLKWFPTTENTQRSRKLKVSIAAGLELELQLGERMDKSMSEKEGARLWGTLHASKTQSFRVKDYATTDGFLSKEMMDSKWKNELAALSRVLGGMSQGELEKHQV